MMAENCFCRLFGHHWLPVPAASMWTARQCYRCGLVAAYKGVPIRRLSTTAHIPSDTIQTQ